jgi:hypothetical protein
VIRRIANSTGKAPLLLLVGRGSGLLLSFPAEPTNTLHFIANAGRIWHKSYRYGTNRIKGISNSDAAVTRSKCLHCNKVESPSHIYAQCRNPALRQQRERIIDSQTKALDRLRIDPTCPDWERRFFRRYHRFPFSHCHDRAEKRGMAHSIPLIFKPFSVPPVHSHCPLSNSKNSGRELCALFPLSPKLLSQWSNFSDNLE